VHDRSVRSALGPVAVFALAACGGEQTVFVPSPPEVEGAQTVVALLSDGAGARAQVAPAPFTAVELSAPFWGGKVPALSTLTLAYYDRPMAEMDLTDGPLPAGPVAPRSCALKAPTATYSTTLRGGVATGWTLEPAPPEAFLSYVLGEGLSCVSTDLCVSFRDVRATLPGAVSVEVLVGLDADTVLAGDVEGHFWRVDRAGTVTPVEALSGAPGRGGYLDRAGRLWLGGEGGQVLRGRLGAPFEAFPVGLPVSVASFDEDPETGELLAAAVETSTAGAEQVYLLRFGDEGWGVVGSLEVPESELAHTRVRFVGAGEALVTYGGPSLLHYNGRTLRNQIVGFANPLFDLQVHDVASLPTYGVVFAANDGRLYRGAAPYDAWIAVAEDTLTTEAEAVRAYRSGFLFGGPNGLLGQYYPAGRRCAPEPLAGSDAEELVVMPDGAVVVSGGPFGATDRNIVTWLFPRE
jgi:hypothetical protein